MSAHSKTLLSFAAPDCSVANPVAGNIAFDYCADHLMVYDGSDWQSLG
jgi:hypothetical protein